MLETKIEDEIDLMDYVKVIIKRRWLILTMFLGAAIIAGIFSFSLPKIYRIDTSLEIGKVGGGKETEAIETIEQVIGKIKGDIYGVFVREKLEISGEGYPKIKTENPKDTKLIAMVIEFAEPEKAKNILEEINQLILAEHQGIIKAKKELINQNIITVESKIKLIENDIESTENKIKPIENDVRRVENKIGYTKEEKKNLENKIVALEKTLIYEQTPGTQFALFDAKEKLANKNNEIENLYLTINSLKRMKEDLEVEINSLKTSIENLSAQINSLRVSLDNIKLTKVIKVPMISENPVKPNKKLNIVIAGILGLFVGMFWAFFAEWWEKSKSKISY